MFTYLENLLARKTSKNITYLEDNFSILKSVINNKKGKSKERLNARAFKVTRIDNSVAEQFFSRTHLHKEIANYDYAYGLVNNDGTVVFSAAFSCTPGKLVLVKFSSQLDTIVRGALSKVLAHVCAVHNTQAVYTYVPDSMYRNIFSNDVYRKLGFTEVGTKSDYLLLKKEYK